MSASTLVDWSSLIATTPATAAAQGLFEYLCPLDRMKFNQILADLNRALALKVPAGKKGSVARGAKSKLVGDTYEKLLQTIFEQSQAVIFERNVRTSTDEIDLLFKVQPLGFTCVPILNRAGTHFIGEAKCHTKAPGSDLCNSLVGVLANHNTRMAFLFVNCTSRKLQAHARNAIALHAARGFEIVPLGRKQIAEIAAGTNVLKVLADQHALAVTASVKLHI